MRGREPCEKEVLTKYVKEILNKNRIFHEFKINFGLLSVRT